jgi:CMP-N-acetylneuraminic acid synthetase
MIENRRYGSKNSRPYILPESRAINVDNNIDFIVAAQIIKNEN